MGSPLVPLLRKGWHGKPEVAHPSECVDCGGDRSLVCDHCKGEGVVWDADCDCCVCIALALVHGLLTEDEATDEGLALFRFWTRHGVEEVAHA